MSRDSGVWFRGVTRTYRTGAVSVDALRAADGAFEAGTIGALVGPSGSGKSTLLRVLAGIDAADTGELAVDGVDIRRLERTAIRRFHRHTVAFLAQRAAANLVPHLTLREHLGRTGAELAVALGLSSRLDAVADRLSGGEQARAAVAVGLSRGTPVVLLDEPTAELDRDSAGRVIEALRTAAAAGRTIVVATHDPDLVALADARLELAAPASADHGEAPRLRPFPSSAATAIDIRGASKRYGGRAVVDGASLAVRGGELGVLLGRSGSGKSTLLMLAGSWLRADAGGIELPGIHWHETAYLAQRFGLLPELSVADNVALPLRLAGGAVDGRVDSVLERLGLASLGDRLPHETSIGQQQRTALARALVVAPAALLADEPTSHQDSASAALVWRALAAACDEGTACLVASHDDAAALHADRVWRIEDGRVTPHS